LRSRFHGWARAQLWWWAFLLALFIVLSWIFGGWNNGKAIGEWIVFSLMGVGFVWLIWEGWVEWRQRDNDDG
jgi:hypothetical protein